MTVVWTECAAGQLEAAKDFLARSSPAFALTLVERILSRTDALPGTAMQGVQVREYSDPALRELFEHPYRVLYRVGKDRIQVIAVVHASRPLPRAAPG